MVSCKGAPGAKTVTLLGGRWYVAYPLSTRHVEALLRKRGVHVDHSTMNRWVVKYSPLLNVPVENLELPASSVKAKYNHH